MTKDVVAVEFGVVTTDIHGNGAFRVTVGPITSGTYNLEFDVRDGAGCNLTGGAGNEFRLRSGFSVARANVRNTHHDHGAVTALGINELQNKLLRA